jgi:hypothetical protein
MTYFQERLQKLGITDDDNKVLLWQNKTTPPPDDGVVRSIAEYEELNRELKPVPVFRQHDRGIEIVPYTIGRSTIRIEKEGSRQKKNWSILRLENPIIKDNGDPIKYVMPKGHGSFPFFPPALLDKYDAKQHIETLFLTEGYFKAFKASMHGMDIVGLASITHLKDKTTDKLHGDILAIIQRCGVRRIVWLTDGDCLDISSKAGTDAKVDLYRRPHSFYASVIEFKRLMSDHLDVDQYFFHIDCDQILENFRDLKRNDVKGLDDLMCSLPDKVPEIVSDIATVTGKSFYFQKFNITAGIAKVWAHFHLDNVTKFYLFQVERNAAIKDKEFIFHGTKYRYDEESGECKVIVPGDASLYCRVGNDYYKFVQAPNKYGNLERTLEGRLKSTIIDDHGKDFVKHVPKYEKFVNVPSHVNYQHIINNCFNLYSPLDFVPSEDEVADEDCISILGFIQHIFGTSKIHFKHPKTGEKIEYTMMDLALDYLQILYHKPAEKLPILCLVSKENNTGKSTFGKLLKQIFGGNCAIVGNQDLAGDFNKHWASKMLTICDETKIDKQHVVEKVKSLSTADKVMMNSKGKDHVEIDCFLKFIFITNNEDNFIYASEDDIRYWIIKVPVITTENPGLLDQMVEEIPAFLGYLNKRKIKTDKLNRMWFHPTLLKTEALKKVIAQNLPTLQKELVAHIKDMFMDFGVDEIRMTATDISRQFFNNKFEKNYLKKILEENLKVDMFHKEDPTNPDMFGKPAKIYTTARYSFPKWEFNAIKKEVERVEQTGIGRPYIFRKDQFLTEHEIKTLRVDPEFRFVNENVGNGPVLTSPVTPIETPNDELPFN